MSTLVYVGTYHGHGALPYIEKHRRNILIEPNPECARFLRQRLGGYKSVEIVEAAVSETDGGRTALRLYGQKAGSASILPITPHAATVCNIDPNPKTVEVRTIRLDEELRRRMVTTIDTLITDAQGMDLQIVKQLVPWLNRGVRHIQCEVDAMEFRCYESQTGNDVGDFDAFFATLEVPYCRTSTINGSHIDCVWELQPLQMTPDR